jgi:hypothetical protein
MNITEDDLTLSSRRKLGSTQSTVLRVDPSFRWDDWTFFGPREHQLLNA